MKGRSEDKGGSGPSGMDADGWRRILLSHNIRETPTNLCGEIVSVIKKLRTEKVSTCSLEPFLESRSIPLNNNSGLRLIDVREILRRTARKVLVSVLLEERFISRFTSSMC